MSDKPKIEDNQTFKDLSLMRDLVAQAINGNIKLLIVCGPPGISKSKQVSDMLKDNSRQSRAEWMSQKIKNPRRTLIMPNDETGDTLAFRPPYVVVRGRITHPQMHCRMYWASFRGEQLFLDDVASLGNPQIQETFGQASDPTSNGEVQYNYHRKNLPDERVPATFNFLGTIIALCNFNRETEMGQIIDLFTPMLLDRADMHHMSFDRSSLLIYVDTMAFQSDPKKGLLRFMFDPLPSERPDLPDEAHGCGFKGSVEQAMDMLIDVRKAFLTNFERVPEISFRTLRFLTKDRVIWGRDWLRYAERHFNPHAKK